MSAEFCKMGSTVWLDSFRQDKCRITVKSSEILQRALLLAAERDNKIAELIGRKRNETASIEKLITEYKKQSTCLEAEGANCVQKISERKTTIARITSDLKSLEVQKKKLLEDVERFRTTLRRQREALVITNGFFKDRMECYIELDSPNDDTFIVAFFCSERRASYDYYAKIKWDVENNVWTVEEMKPKVSCQQAIAKNLARTGDIQGFLYHVRKLYLGFKLKSK